MTDKEERAYIAGRRMVFEQQFREAAAELGLAISEDGKRLEGSYAVERNATVRALRSLCEEFGDNDWEDDLSLEDVIEKHLAPYLHDRRRGKRG